MFKIPEDVQQQLQESVEASKRQQEYRDRMLSMMLTQLDELNRCMSELVEEVSGIAEFLDGVFVEVGEDDAE